MTTSIAQKYLSLLSDLRSYVEQEHPKGSWIATDADTYAYFRELASKTPPKTKQSPITIVPPPAPALEKIIPAPPPQRSLPAYTKEQTPVTSTTPPPLKSEPKPVKPEPLTKAFTREAPSLPTRRDFTELLTFFKKQLPNVELSETIADDSAAKAFLSRRNAPSAEIVILSFSELANEQSFVANLAHALNQCLAPTNVLSAKKIEDEKGWEIFFKADKLRLVIVSNYNLHTLPELLKHFHEDATGKHRLGKAKAYLLSDLSLYMQQPTLKASLWKTLCQLYP